MSGAAADELQAILGSVTFQPLPTPTPAPEVTATASP
jgi:hypothetical protein